MTENFYGKKVVPAKELSNLEKKAFKENVDEEQLMLKAGKAVALSAKEIIQKKKQKKIIVLAGKGNNAADGFVASIELQKMGFCVEAFYVFPKEKCSFLCQKYMQLFKDEGGKLFLIREKEEIKIEKDDILIDGLLGTGFHGDITGIFYEIIKKVNETKCFTLAIDIPSGLEGNTGKVNTIAIKANTTLTFSISKLGFYINDGPNYSGKVKIVDIGLPQKYLDEVNTNFFLLDEKKIKNFLPAIEKKRHKYQAGAVLGIAGSEGMTGAACLASLASLRSGAGIVWLFSTNIIEKAPYEVITYRLDGNIKKLFQHLEKTKAVFLGPGIGRTNDTQTLLKELFQKIKIPCVIDADALFFLANNKDVSIPSSSILTPHKKEMTRLLGKEDINEIDLLDKCQKYANDNNAILVLKGAPTFVFHPKKNVIIIDRGDPALATAGTGDVLTGVMAAFLAQKLEPYVAALLGVFIHGIAGEIAAVKKTSFSVIASDIIENLSEAFKQVFNKY